MPDGEHAAVQAMQKAGAAAVGDRAAPEAGMKKLKPAHDAVLTRGDHGDDSVGSELVELFSHHVDKSTRPETSPPADRGGSSCRCVT